MSVVVSLTLLLGIELGLRLLIGPPRPILGLIPVSQVTLVEQGDEVVLSHLIDPRQDVRVPRARGDRPRVVFLGGSSVRHTYSVPDDHNFPSHVQALAPELEILNLASPGQTTPTLAALVEHLDALNPDLIVLHTGHNDYADVVFAGVPRWDNPLLNVGRPGPLPHGRPLHRRRAPQPARRPGRRRGDHPGAAGLPRPAPRRGIVNEVRRAR